MAAEISTNPILGKRSLQDLEPFLSVGAPAAKHACTETPPVSAHLSLLEELCDLEGDDAESSMEPSSAAVSSTLAEMMKSLERVIEEGESRVITGVASTSRRSSEAPSPFPDSSVVDFVRVDDGSPVYEAESSFHGGLEYEEEFDGEAQIRHLLHVSDDELGIPASSSSSDIDDSSFHEEWASLSDQSGPSATLNFSWLDAPFQQFEESRVDFYEPVILF